MKIWVLLVTLAVAGVAEATPVGTYTCVTKTNAKAKVVGGKTQQSSVTVTTSTTLQADGTTLVTTPALPFASHGTWSQVGKRIIFTADQNDLAKAALYPCTAAGASCTFVGASSTSSLTINKAENAIKGTGKSTLSMLVNGFLVTSTGTSSISCRR